MYVKWTDVNIAKDKKLAEFPLVLVLDKYLCVYNVTMRENINEDVYYVFNCSRGKDIMNFGKRHYDVLKEKLPIDDISIFQVDDRLGVIAVSEEYRLK